MNPRIDIFKYLIGIMWSELFAKLNKLSLIQILYFRVVLQHLKYLDHSYRFR